MAIAKITTWLNDPRRDYNYGLLLYDQYGTSSLLKTLFKNGNSSYHQDRLFSALEELNPTLEELTNQSSFRIPTVQEMPVPAKKYGVSNDVWEKLPQEVQDLYALSSRLHRHSQLLFDQARIASSDEERGKLGRQILLERKQLNETWTTIKDYHAQGVLKEKIREQEETPVNELSIHELTKQLKNIPTYLSKDRKKVLPMPDGPKKNKVLLRIQTYEAQIDLIKKRLEEMQ
jgi:hypothetical protein